MERIVVLSSNPSRDELRDARRELLPLAKRGDDQAKAELAAVEEVIRRRFPREIDSSDPSRRGWRKAASRRQKPITPEACAYPCPYCRGQGGRDVMIVLEPPAPAPVELPSFGAASAKPIDGAWWYGPLFNSFWRAEASPEASAPEAPEASPEPEPEARPHRWECRECKGTGTLYGTGEQVLDPAQGDPHYAVSSPGKTPKWRGLYTAPDGAPRRPKHAGVTPPPTRGFAAGRSIGARRRAGGSWCWIPGEGCAQGRSAVDESAHAEGQAHSSLRARIRSMGLEKPRNQRKMGSGRDKTNLKGRQQRRSQMSDRVRKLQAEHNRANPTAAQIERREELASIRALERRGVDCSDLRAELDRISNAPPTAQVESAIIAEARRRGDLPPADETPDGLVRPVPKLA